MTEPVDPVAVAAESEQVRLAAQAEPEQRRADAAGDAVLDPNSPEGRQNALSRGDPVQLSDADALNASAVAGTNPTSNETPVHSQAPVPEVPRYPSDVALSEQQAAEAEAEPGTAPEPPPWPAAEPAAGAGAPAPGPQTGQPAVPEQAETPANDPAQPGTDQGEHGPGTVS